MRQILLAIVAIFGFVASAQAQQPVFSTSTAGTIATTNTFQIALQPPAAPAVRRGCSIQNLGTNNMFVNFGSATPAATTSIKLIPGAIIRCDAGGIVLQDQINITGTSADTFVVLSQ